MTSFRIPRTALAPWLVFIAVSVLVVTSVSQPWDVAALRMIGHWRSGGLTRIMQAISGLGNWEGEVPLALLVAGLLSLRGRRRDAISFLFTAISAEALYAVCKALFRRPRPEVISHLSGAAWYSYPSGHAVLAPVIWGYGLLLLGSLAHSRSVRVACRVIAIVMVAAIGLSRSYLGVHYPTDVLAGLALGTAWALGWLSGARLSRDGSVQPSTL